MDLSTALAQTKPQIGATCSIAKMLVEVDQETARQITEALADRKLSNAHLSRAFTLMGHKMTDGVIQRHRTHGCRCES